ncbi:MAG: YbaN family protein [Bacteriovoracaceae bacterium]
MTSSKRLIFLICGWISIALGIAGIPLPILPTTPFILLAAFCFSKSSPKLHSWLLKHPRLGPIVGDWQRHGVIRTRAKVISTIMILILFSYTLIYVQVPLWIKSIVALSGIGVLIFINSRPSQPKS